ncbi:hypothetical protein ACFO3J_02210 [Streptomyces polygonati]|uniref:Large membrane protein n=1 Tax=Streptomyces polygonati TaxID=1617087 RepID=A0ABV8HHJ3_9ACTN
MSTERDDRSVEHPEESVTGPAERHDEAERVRRPAGRSRLTVGAVAAAVLLAGAGGAFWVAKAGGGENRTAERNAAAPLRLDDPRPPGSGAPAPGGALLRLTGSLPEEGPKSAAVYRATAAVDEAQAERLAALLKVGGPTASVSGSWQVGRVTNAGPALLVSRAAPGNWSYTGSPAAPPPAPGTGTGSPPVSARRAEAVAAPLLAGLGLTGARIDAAQTVGAERIVTADPVVGGLPTSGWRTTLRVGPDGTLTGASGRLSALAEGASYQVVSATAAFQRLVAASGPHPDHGVSSCVVPMVPVAPGGRAAPAGPGGDRKLARTLPCVAGSGHPTQVRGAVFGLSPASVSGVQTLIPSWLFDTAPAGVSVTTVLAEPAVDPAYLQTPGGGPGTTAPGAPAPLPPGGPVDPGGPMRPGGPAAPPVSQRPADPPPVAAPPAAPLPGDPSPAGQAVKVSGYHADGSTLDIEFSGGVCSTYQARVAETDGQVRVTVTDTPDGKHRMCPMIARDFTRTVVLQQPLGNRTVVDTSDGQPVRGQ